MAKVERIHKLHCVWQLQTKAMGTNHNPCPAILPVLERSLLNTPSMGTGSPKAKKTGTLSRDKCPVASSERPPSYPAAAQPAKISTQVCPIWSPFPTVLGQASKSHWRVLPALQGEFSTTTSVSGSGRWKEKRLEKRGSCAGKLEQRRVQKWAGVCSKKKKKGGNPTSQVCRKKMKSAYLRARAPPLGPRGRSVTQVPLPLAAEGQ